MEDKSLLSTLLTWLVAGILVIVAIKVVFVLLGITMALVGILFKILPLVLAVWLAVQVYRWFRGPRGEPDLL